MTKLRAAAELLQRRHVAGLAATLPPPPPAPLAPADPCRARAALACLLLGLEVRLLEPHAALARPQRAAFRVPAPDGGFRLLTVPVERPREDAAAHLMAWAQRAGALGIAPRAYLLPPSLGVAASDLVVGRPLSGPELAAPGPLRSAALALLGGLASVPDMPAAAPHAGLLAAPDLAPLDAVEDLARDLLPDLDERLRQRLDDGALRHRRAAEIEVHRLRRRCDHVRAALGGASGQGGGTAEVWPLVPSHGLPRAHSFVLEAATGRLLLVGFAAAGWRERVYDVAAAERAWGAGQGALGELFAGAHGGRPPSEAEYVRLLLWVDLLNLGEYMEQRMRGDAARAAAAEQRLHVDEALLTDLPDLA